MCPYKFFLLPHPLPFGTSQGQAQVPNGFYIECWEGARFYLQASQFRAHVLPLPAVRKILQLDAHASPALCSLSSTEPTPRPHLLRVRHQQLHQGLFLQGSLPLGSWRSEVLSLPWEAQQPGVAEDPETIQPDVLVSPRKDKSLAFRHTLWSFNRGSLTRGLVSVVAKPQENETIQCRTLLQSLELEGQGTRWSH